MLENVETLTVPEFQEMVKKGVAMLYISAPWCAPCKMMSPTVEELASVMGIRVIKVNADTNYPITKFYSVLNIPTLITFKDGVIVNRSIGRKDDWQLRAIFMMASKV